MIGMDKLELIQWKATRMGLTMEGEAEGAGFIGVTPLKPSFL